MRQRPEGAGYSGTPISFFAISSPLFYGYLLDHNPSNLPKCLYIKECIIEVQFSFYPSDLPKKRDSAPDFWAKIADIPERDAVFTPLILCKEAIEDTAFHNRIRTRPCEGIMLNCFEKQRSKYSEGPFVLVFERIINAVKRIESFHYDPVHKIDVPKWYDFGKRFWRNRQVRIRKKEDSLDIIKYYAVHIL
jgi:hypothetical protein